jgi:hypothetical protein
MTWQVDPFLLSFLDSLELELASALEIQHLRGDDVPAGKPISRLRENDRIVTLEVAIDALQAALDRGESPTVH